MTTPTCIWRGLDQPRAIKGRHAEDCEGDCRGCLDCTEPHCPGCNLSHGSGVCPGCVADVREDLTEVTRMCQAIPAEAVVKGVDSDAFDLAGPVANPEAFEHRTMSAAMGRIDAGWLECADDLAHPLWVLGTAEMRAREVLGLPEPEGRMDVLTSAAWLDGRLSILAACADHDWVELRREVSACRRLMERVLHDGEQIVQGAPCLADECKTRKVRLVRVWTGDELPWVHRDGSRPRASEDGWVCPRCREVLSEDRYRWAVAQEHHEQQLIRWREADRLTAPQMEAAHGIKPGALTGWASKGVVTKHGLDAKGRMLYDVEQARERAGQSGRMGA